MSDRMSSQIMLKNCVSDRFLSETVVTRTVISKAGVSENAVSESTVAKRVGLQAALHKESAWSKRTEKRYRTLSHKMQSCTTAVLSSWYLQSHRLGLGFLVVTLALMLNSCGFHLRGAMPLSDALMQVSLEQETEVLTPMERSVQQALEQRGASVLTDSGAFVRLRLTDVEFSRFPLSTQTDNRVGSYEYQYQMHYQVEDLVRPARPKLTGQISSRQTQDAFEDNPIGQEQAEAQLQRRLEKEMAERLVRILALQTRHWATSTSVSLTNKTASQDPAPQNQGSQPQEITHAP